MYDHVIMKRERGLKDIKSSKRLMMVECIIHIFHTWMYARKRFFLRIPKTSLFFLYLTITRFICHVHFLVTDRLFCLPKIVHEN